VRADALADRVRALARSDGTRRSAACFVSETPPVLAAMARAVARWPADCAPPLRLPISERWCWTDDTTRSDGARLPLWRGGHHAGDDARSAASAYDRLPRPLGLALLEVDERGGLGAFDAAAPTVTKLLEPQIPPTVAAVDAADDGPPWLTFTLSALLAVERIAIVLPAGAAPADLAGRSTALAALVDHAAVPVTFHGVG
jgi:hypothetical protein